MTRHAHISISLRRAPLVALIGICSLIAQEAHADEDNSEEPAPPAAEASETYNGEDAETVDQHVGASPTQPATSVGHPWQPDMAAPIAPSTARLRTNWNDGLPDTLTYYADQPAPDGYYLDSRPRYGLIGAGAGILGGTWLVSMGTAIYFDNEPDGSKDPNFDDNYWPLFIPVAGPFVTIGTADSSGTGAAILALDGVVQMGSLAMIIAGFAAPKTELVRKEWHFDVTPLVSSTMTGLGVSGSM